MLNIIIVFIHNKIQSVSKKETVTIEKTLALADLDHLYKFLI